MAEAGTIREAVSPPRGWVARASRAILYRLRRKKQEYVHKTSFGKGQYIDRSPLSPAETKRVNQEMVAERELKKKYEKQLEERAREQQREEVRRKMIEASKMEQRVEREELLRKKQQLQEKYRRRAV